MAQAQEFRAVMLDEMGDEELRRSEGLDPPAAALPPVIVEDHEALTAVECAALKAEYYGPNGVASFLVRNPSPLGTTHPLLKMAEQLVRELPVRYPLPHPLETHSEAIRRFGDPDGTLKIYNLEKKPGGYREQGETAEDFGPHNDGMGSGGTVRTVFVYMDVPPLWGGFTHFHNLARLSLRLATTDWEAFEHLFVPDAVTALRPRGKGALLVRGPALYLNEENRPQIFYRTTTGEYEIRWRADLLPLQRAAKFLSRCMQAFSAGSSFVHLTRRGQGYIIRNEHVVHGRTAFVDGSTPAERRLVSRKWFMRSERDSVYKHVPGLFVRGDYAGLFPELFAEGQLAGEWLFDASTGENRRFK